MKVLFCSPYVQSPEYVQGGVVVWGANIINYYKTLPLSDIDLVPISFDRKTYSENHKSSVGAFFSGMKELMLPVWKTIKALRKGDVDVVHICTNTGITMLKDYLIILVARHYNVKSYVHYHCGTIPILLNPKQKLHRLFIRNLSIMTKCVTMDLRSYNALRNYGIKNIVNLPNPLSLTITNQVLQKKSAVKKIPGRIAFVGNVLRSKGILELIESCCKLGFPDLHVIGKIQRSEKEDIDAILHKYNTDDSWITWTGEIPHDEVLIELLQSEIFAFPSYSEGFPNVILEAMVCGCAIVTTSVGAIPEMLDVTSDSCGLCVEPQNVDAFYKALKSVYCNDELIAEFSSKAARRVNSLYSIEKVWEQMVATWRG